MGLAGKLKTGLKNKFGPVEHEQGATKSNQKEEEGEKEEYEEGWKRRTSSRRTNSRSREGEQEYA